MSMKTKIHKPIEAQTAQLAQTEHLIGPNGKGPAKCLRCQQPFKKGECWQRETSLADPIYSAYSIGIHDRCASQR